VSAPPARTREEYIAFLDTVTTNSRSFNRVCARGWVDLAQQALVCNPEIDPNQVLGAGDTPMIHEMCSLGSESILAIFLAHPDVDVNQKSKDKETPFFAACANGRTACVRLLLGDARVRTTELNADGRTALWYAADAGYVGVIKWWIASGREIDAGKMGKGKTDPVEAARVLCRTETVDLLKRFIFHPEVTRAEVRKELGITGKWLSTAMAAGLVTYFSLFWLDFLVTSPPKLSDKEYKTFLTSLPPHPSTVDMAIEEGLVDKAGDILRNNPAIDVNWSDRAGNTLLHRACKENCLAIVQLLLDNPAIDVNRQNNTYLTPFYLALRENRASLVYLLLRDSRVNVNNADDYNHTPLKWAVIWGSIDLIEWWIASGREVEPVDQCIRTAMDRGRKMVTNLLQRMMENPKQVRHELRVKLGWYDAEAADLFALVVFLSDGLLRVKRPYDEAARFFVIAAQLPLELQAVLCRRVVGSSKTLVDGKGGERAFRDLARRLQVL